MKFTIKIRKTLDKLNIENWEDMVLLNDIKKSDWWYIFEWLFQNKIFSLYIGTRIIQFLFYIIFQNFYKITKIRKKIVYDNDSYYLDIWFCNAIFALNLWYQQI